jgi:hypothetical protein
MRKKSRIIFALCVILAILLSAIVLYNIEKGAFKDKSSNLEGQSGNLNSQVANISTTLNTVDKYYSAPGFFASVPCLIINGTVENLGGAEAHQVGLQVVAYDTSTKTVAMKITIPLNNGAFEYEVGSTYHAILASADILSSLDRSECALDGFETQRVTTCIFHQSLFVNSTVYMITPVWANTGSSYSNQ